MERHIQMMLDQNRKAISTSLRETAKGITPYDVHNMRNVLESQKKMMNDVLAKNALLVEAGHGLQARTITEARAGPRLQIVAEGGMDLLEADKNWEKSLFPKVLKLAERLASEAQRQSQWHKRMNAHNLNQSGSRVEDNGLSLGDRVYFYKPPTQQEVARRGRKAKHLAHYHGPAIVQSQIQGRDRQYNITYNGKQFKRDISMLIPERTF
jgi:hypothetical protein